jgi:hypothetical protein
MEVEVWDSHCANLQEDMIDTGSGVRAGSGKCGFNKCINYELKVFTNKHRSLTVCYEA